MFAKMEFKVVAVCIFVFATLISVDADNIMSLIQACKKEEGCTENLVDILRKQQDPTTHECVCAVGCLGQKKEVITADNKINEDNLKKMVKKMHLTEEKAQAAVSACAATTGADKCEVAQKLGECIKANS